MFDIDYIMDLLDWNKNIEQQTKGLELASKVKNFNVFIQPCNENYNKNVWDNCAKILSKKTDQELSPYLIELMKWLQDMNWPGAFCILDRLKKFEDKQCFHQAYNTCLKISKALKDSTWRSNLKMMER